MAAYLAFKEIWRNRGRFVLFSLVIALITTLVLFVAALAEGLGSGNREFLQGLNNANLVVYQKKSDLLAAASSLSPSKVRSIRHVDGVAAAGPIAFSNVSISWDGGTAPLKVALIGVEPGLPGEPPVVMGRTLRDRNAREVILDRSVALRTGLKPGDTLTVRSTQGTDEKLYPLTVVGISVGQQYALQPSVIVPFSTWDRVRAKADVSGDPNAEIIANLVAVQLTDPSQANLVAAHIEDAVADTQAVDRKTAYEALPGYTAQQSTLDTQKYFALLIGVLVIGGFFQIQTLQKVPQIGMLKAIGASNLVVGTAAILQIIIVTVLGVGIGAGGTLLLSLGFPPTIPIVFSANAVAASVAALMLIGPLGGLVSIRYSVRVEPLTALGLAQ
jgi:putative ABC transport system permease protein